MKLAICTKFQVNQTNCVESRRGAPIDPPSRLRVTIFSRRLLGLRIIDQEHIFFNQGRITCIRLIRLLFSYPVYMVIAVFQCNIYALEIELLMSDNGFSVAKANSLQLNFKWNSITSASRLGKLNETFKTRVKLIFNSTISQLVNGRNADKRPKRQA